MYVGRPDVEHAGGPPCWIGAMTELGNGLFAAGHHEDALSVQEAELAVKLRVGASENKMLIVQTNLATTYQKLGQSEEALRMRRDVYSGRVRLNGEEHQQTVIAANNFAASLVETQQLHNFEEAKMLLSKTIPAAQRVLGDDNYCTLVMKKMYAATLGFAVLSELRGSRVVAEVVVQARRRAPARGSAAHPNVGVREDAVLTPDKLEDLREATTMHAETARTARRVLGPTNPFVQTVESNLRAFRAVLRAHEEGDMSALHEVFEAALRAPPLAPKRSIS